MALMPSRKDLKVQLGRTCALNILKKWKLNMFHEHALTDMKNSGKQLETQDHRSRLHTQITNQLKLVKSNKP